MSVSVVVSVFVSVFVSVRPSWALRFPCLHVCVKGGCKRESEDEGMSSREQEGEHGGKSDEGGRDIL